MRNLSEIIGVFQLKSPSLCLTQCIYLYIYKNTYKYNYISANAFASLQPAAVSKRRNCTQSNLPKSQC